jgi:hypothetical protein
MRETVRASTQATAIATRVFHSKRKVNLKLQIFDPVTVYAAQNQNDLQSGMDPVGNPSRGFQLTQGIYDFLGFNGELWLICNQQIEVEFQWWFL